MIARLSPALLATVLVLATGQPAAADIVRCKGPGGHVTYQAAPCADREEESRPRIAVSYPEPNKAESQRIFEREAALDRRLEARRDRELQEQQMREARAEREAERERLAMLAAAQQPQYVVAYPAWGVHPIRRTPYAMPRHVGRPIR